MRRVRPLTLMVLTTWLVAGAVGQPVAFASSAQPADQAVTSVVVSVEAPGSSGFPTPEDAVHAYLQGVAAADLATILEASAIDEIAEGFRFDLLVDRIRAFMPISTQAPTDYPFYADLNRVRLTDQILRQVLMLDYSLLLGEAIDGRPVLDVDGAWAETFVAQVDPSRLAGLEVKDIRFPDATFETNDRWLENAAEQASIFGADELTERLALLSFDGGLYDVGFTLVRYEDGWKVSSQNSVIGQTESIGSARPTTLEDYERQTLGG